MDTKALRQKILDLAIRGKLVPQNPEDEPASILLERIRKEKQQMVKDGRLKAKDVKNDSVIYVGEDSLHYEKFADGTVKCIEDEIPFKVPEGWEWERLGNITTIARGGSPRPIEAYITDSNEGINWIKIGDTEKDGKYIHSTKEKIIPEGVSKSRYVSSGDFLLTNSMSFGRPYILKTDGCIHDGWLVIGNIAYVFHQDYLYYALSSNFMYQSLVLLAVGSTVKNLKSDSVKTVLFPIPPMPEQKRLVKKVEELIKHVNSVSSTKKELYDILEKTKVKILSLAIRGKLVSQDPTDEPASVLLDRIKAEREDLIKQGKIKHDSKESIIFKGDDRSYYEKCANGSLNCIDEEITFDIPDNWELIRLSNIVTKEIKRGKTPKYTDTSKVKVFAQKCNLKSGGITLKSARFLDETVISKYPEDEFLLCGDIVINSTGTGTLGRIGYYNLKNNKVVPDSHITTIRTSHIMESQYIYVYLKSMQSLLEKSGEGSTNQKELKPDLVKSLIVPIPPINEQCRILKKLISLDACISNIEANLS